MKRITVHLSDQLHKDLKVYCVQHDESISRVVALAVNTLLNGDRIGPSKNTDVSKV